MVVVANHHHPAAGLVQHGRHDAAVQHAREALELLGRRVRRAYLVRPGLIKYQLEPKWILQPAHKAPGGVGLSGCVTGHAGGAVVANVSIIRYGSLMGYRIGQVQPRSMYS